eukprot:CAMPEP_0203840070 /NCGR_PEP_ID=MMETSP0359-20131031/558_1 /ASSEMBLY_ACC=CAM_ASM_000338 /TAXON_ID=268821 /ORGANISM="Scrippsiella Hangoei, Strain SHTV-5" /LENGTH=105 /DNA_ID=CAMNT_0050754217 /DNA_START=125 /DNA_END=439 /DNA_ORIENTATION=+
MDDGVCVVDPWAQFHEALSWHPCTSSRRSQLTFKSLRDRSLFRRPFPQARRFAVLLSSACDLCRGNKTNVRMWIDRRPLNFAEPAHFSVDDNGARGRTQGGGKGQ